MIQKQNKSEDYCTAVAPQQIFATIPSMWGLVAKWINGCRERKLAKMNANATKTKINTVCVTITLVYNSNWPAQWRVWHQITSALSPWLKALLTGKIHLWVLLQCSQPQSQTPPSHKGQNFFNWNAIITWENTAWPSNHTRRFHPLRIDSEECAKKQ